MTENESLQNQIKNLSSQLNAMQDEMKELKASAKATVIFTRVADIVLFTIVTLASTYAIAMCLIMLTRFTLK